MNGLLVQVNGKGVAVPTLDIDARHEGRMNARGRLERRLVAALIAHLDAAGFIAAGIDGYDEGRYAINPRDLEHGTKAAMELAFNLDECWLIFEKKGDRERENAVYLVFGNGIDLVSDWRFQRDDVDGFNQAMQAFKAEDFA